MHSVNDKRYDVMKYRRCGRSGVLLPEISLGFWQHFSDKDDYENCRSIVLEAFDRGITHFDLADNYGGGTSQEVFGRILHNDLERYRDEMFISTKAGYDMWSGPYGNWGSRKHLIASLDMSLEKMGLDYVDVFYSHRPDYDTPLEETMDALASVVRAGKALYVGISNYPADIADKAVDILSGMGVKCLVHQARYSMLHRDPENGLLNVLGEKGVGMVAFQCLGQGLLSCRYLNGIPEDSRILKGKGSLKREDVTASLLSRLGKLDMIAKRRGQTLASLALCWVLRDERIASVILGASSLAQLEDSLSVIDRAPFGEEELGEIESILQNAENRVI